MTTAVIRLAATLALGLLLFPNAAAAQKKLVGIMAI